MFKTIQNCSRLILFKVKRILFSWQNEWPLSPNPGTLCCVILALLLTGLTIMANAYLGDSTRAELQTKNCKSTFGVGNGYPSTKLCYECAGLFRLI